jgi:hypothetical protein
MPELDLQKADEWFEVTRKTSTAYGNEFLIDISPSKQPYPGASEIIISQAFSAPLLSYVRFFTTAAVNQEGREVSISGWLEKKDPFTQGDLLDSEEDQVQQLIYQIKTSLSIPYRKSLANRLVALLNDAKEEEDFVGVGIAADSLRNFYYFFQLYTDLKCPIVSLTPDNDIYGSWRVEPNRLFSVHFLPNGDARFVIFKPNDLHPERQIRIYGIATTDILKKTVETHGVWDWISE